MTPRDQTSIPPDDDEASLISSQSTVTTMDFVQRANQMMADTKRRRDAKRSKIESDRAKRIKDVKRKLDALHDNRRTQRTKLQEAQWSRLHLLNERRHKLEDQILNSIMLIESQTLIMALYCLKIKGYF
ncbi:hypothetical protein EYC80_006259 [Monilinia laxa]|uniref:Uncharacterized protein n=1 Tax=Monilinia laxa TaxID=61186 RepID=A0A5N6KGN6_MONLA|nr:hypothetical protein EYC80_006259 [Monilinia laxa]